VVSPGLAGAERSACGESGYSYAGVESSSASHGIAATLSAARSPRVQSGHVAAWVGVGGYGLGPSGSDAWLQVGLTSRPDGSGWIYSEVKRPGAAPRVVVLRRRVGLRERHRVAISEVASRPGWWRVSVDSRPVGSPVLVPSGRTGFRAIATAESWDGGRAACNRFAYRFERVAVVARLGGPWESLVDGSEFQDDGYRLVSMDEASFLAASAVEGGGRNSAGRRPLAG